MEDTVVLDSFQETQQGSLKRRLLYGDKKKFDKYVRTTTTHGIRQIFTGKSKIRRLFWAILFLLSFAGCLYGVIRSIIIYSEVPTATTVYTDHVSHLTFPVVTVCNLNGYQLSVLNEKNLTDYISNSMLRNRLNEDSSQACAKDDYNFDTKEPIASVIQRASQPLKDLIVECTFLGEPCDLESSFTAYDIPTGTCYSFNDNNETREHLSVTGSGFRHSLQLVLNVRHDSYIGSPQHEAGVLVSVHEQGAPALIWESGVAVPIGHSAYLRVRRNQIEDRTDRRDSNANVNCINEPEPFQFIAKYKYSYRACRVECILSHIAEECDCTPNFNIVNGNTEDFRECTILDLCCIFKVYDNTSECPCPVLCNHTSFDVTPSYSTFPASGKFIRKYNFSSLDDALKNLLQVRVFFGDLSIHREITVQSYSLPALIANIGGSMGLFLGASIISFTEFLTLIFDAIKDRLCGIREKRIKNLWNSYKHKKDALNMDGPEIDMGGYDVYIDSVTVDSDSNDSTGSYNNTHDNMPLS